MWEKEKLLVSSNFSFSHSVFKRLVLQTHKTQGLFGKGLKKKRHCSILFPHRRYTQVCLKSFRPTLQRRFLTPVRIKPFGNIVGNWNKIQHFLLFLRCFLPYERHFQCLNIFLICRLQMISIWTNFVVLLNIF